MVWETRSLLMSPLALGKSILLSISVITLGCRDSPARQLENSWCTLEQRPGILLDISDSASGKAAVAGSTIRVFRGGDLIEHVRGANASGLAGGAAIAVAHEKSGTLRVVVEHPEFETWDQEVNLERDICHVETARLAVKLKPKVK